MSRIMNRAVAVAMLSGAASISMSPAAAAPLAEPGDYPALEVMCDSLGPDTFVFAETHVGGRIDETPVIGWIDVTTWDARTGNFLSHDRVFERQPNLAVDQICSFEPATAAGTETVTIGFVMDGEPGLLGSDARSAWDR